MKIIVEGKTVSTGMTSSVGWKIIGGDQYVCKRDPNCGIIRYAVKEITKYVGERDEELFGDVFQVTNMILDEIREMPVNSASVYPFYGILVKKSEKQTYIHCDAEMHYSKDPTNLRPFIMKRVRKVCDLQRLKDECEMTE